MRKSRISAISAAEDQWLRRAYAAAVAGAKQVVGPDHNSPIRSHTTLGQLGASQWGWLVSGAIWGWVSTRAQQASDEGWDQESTIHLTGLEPEPWDAGMVISILPKLADACGADIDWAKPLNEWSKEMMGSFLLAAFRLIRHAEIARDVTEDQMSAKPVDANALARRLNAAAGGPLMTPAEFNDELPSF
jgi:hypothetical protein